MESVKWAVCPACSEEWTKLRPCRFINEEGKDDSDSMCVQCAERVKGLMYADKEYPIPGVELEFKWFSGSHFRIPHKIYQHQWEPGQPEPPFYEYTDHVVDESKRYAVVKYQSMVFVVTAQSHAPHIQFKGTDGVERFADNVLSAWSMIRHAINKGDSTEVSTPSFKSKKEDWMDR